MSATFMPQTASARDIQRNFKAIRERAIKHGPVAIFNQQKADVALVKIELLDELQSLRQQQIDRETESALQAIRIAKKEDDAESLQELHSFKDIL